MNIKELRKITGLSQKKFSEKFKIPVRTIQNWESGTNPTPVYTEKLIEMQLILENEIEALRAGQLQLTSSEPEEQPKPEPEPKKQQQPQEETNTDTVRKEIFRTIKSYLESEDFDGIKCIDCIHDRNNCDDFYCAWKDYKHYNEYKKIIEEELNK